MTSVCRLPGPRAEPDLTERTTTMAARPTYSFGEPNWDTIGRWLHLDSADDGPVWMLNLMRYRRPRRLHRRPCRDGHGEGGRRRLRPSRAPGRRGSHGGLLRRRGRATGRRADLGPRRHRSLSDPDVLLRDAGTGRLQDAVRPQGSRHGVHHHHGLCPRGRSPGSGSGTGDGCRQPAGGAGPAIPRRRASRRRSRRRGAGRPLRRRRGGARRRAGVGRAPLRSGDRRRPLPAARCRRGGRADGVCGRCDHRPADRVHPDAPTDLAELWRRPRIRPRRARGRGG